MRISIQVENPNLKNRASSGLSGVSTYEHPLDDQYRAYYRNLKQTAAAASSRRLVTVEPATEEPCMVTIRRVVDKHNQIIMYEYGDCLGAHNPPESSNYSEFMSL